ncbi:MAG TPA: hypothetical protein DCR63_04885 [Microbacterium sp.]|nr:hypothetical protein [Microbacterium sp.]
MPPPPSDRFDDISASPGRVGAHRAENPRVLAWTTLLWASVATIVLIVVGIFASLVFQGQIVLFPAPAPTVSASPAAPAVVDTSFTVLVLNGTPEEGQATLVKDELLANGWAEDNVLAGNAGDRAFPLTTVYYAEAEAEGAARGLAGLIGASEVVLDPEYPLPGTPATQLTVVLGMDRVEADPAVDPPEPAEE